MTKPVDLSNLTDIDLLDELHKRLEAGDRLPEGIRIRHSDVIGYAWLIGGVYSHQNTRAAAEAIAQLVRYLNHATQRDSSVPYLSTADAVISFLSTAAHGLVQLFEQLAARVDTDVHRKSVYNNRDSDNADLAAETLAQLKEEILQSRLAAGSLASQLNHVFENSSNRLGNLTNVDGQLIDRDRKPV